MLLHGELGEYLPDLGHVPNAQARPVVSWSSDEFLLSPKRMLPDHARCSPNTVRSRVVFPNAVATHHTYAVARANVKVNIPERVALAVVLIQRADLQHS